MSAVVLTEEDRKVLAQIRARLHRNELAYGSGDDLIEGALEEAISYACRELNNARAEIARLRDIIRTGGASYRAERSAMGIPGGMDPAP